jgi:hypothetical protein
MQSALLMLVFTSASAMLLIPPRQHCGLVITSFRGGAAAFVRRSYTTTQLRMYDDRTYTNVKPSAIKFGHHDKAFLLGSCFTEVIGSKLKQDKFGVFMNPQGIMFNPLSLASCLDNVIKKKRFTENDIFEDTINDDVLHSFEHSTMFSHPRVAKNEMLNMMNDQIQIAHEHLASSKFLFITLGSAFIHSRNGHCVANCHRQPASMFEKSMLTILEMQSRLKAVLEKTRLLNPTINVVLTVSPVRHTREGLMENSKSKATLLCAAHSLVDDVDLNSYVSYFPAYEILMDELRDYRWYEEDLIHPSSAARNIVYDYFASCYFSERTQNIRKEVQSFKKSVDHRPHIPQSQAYRKHLRSTMQRAEKLHEQYQRDGLNFESDIAEISKMAESLDISL